MTTRKKGISAIEAQGMLLVFPINNQKEPASLWTCFYPRSQMKWEWDEGGDDRVARLWHLREELSRSGSVVYAKWYRGRATFFSKEIFTCALRVLNVDLREHVLKRDLSSASKNLFELLQSDSPLSGKVLRKFSGLQGKENEKTYTHALKHLWDRLLIVGHGEIDDGAFPSLAVGATPVLFESLWNEALGLSDAAAWKTLEKKLGEDSLFYLQLRKQARLVRQNGVTQITQGWSPEQLGR